MMQIFVALIAWWLVFYGLGTIIEDGFELRTSLALIIGIGIGIWLL